MPGPTIQEWKEDLYPGLVGTWGDYPLYASEFDKIFPFKSSEQAYEKSWQYSDLPAPAKRPMGEGTKYVNAVPGPTREQWLDVWSLGFQVAKQMATDDLYKVWVKTQPGNLKKTMYYGREMDFASWFALGGSTSLLADGSTFIGKSHTLLGGGTFANCPSKPCDASFTAYQQMNIDVQNYNTDFGKIMPLRKKMGFCTPTNEWTVQQILKSPKRPDIPASNAENPAMNLFTAPPFSWHYLGLSWPRAWGVLLDVPMGLVGYYHSKWGKDPSFERDNEFDSDVMKVKSTMRYSYGCDDPRCVYMSFGLGGPF